MTRFPTLAVLAVVGALVAPAAQAQQGSTPTTPTGVSRVVLIRIKPGHSAEFWNDVRQHLKPIYDEEKRRGIIADWSMETKVTTDREEDWSVALGITYRNWAALDNVIALAEPVTLAHYGTAEKRTAATMARGEHGAVVQSILLRNVTVNDWK